MRVEQPFIFILEQGPKSSHTAGELDESAAWLIMINAGKTSTESTQKHNMIGQAEMGTQGPGEALRKPFSFTRNIYGYQRSRGKSPTYEYSALPEGRGQRVCGADRQTAQTNPHPGHNSRRICKTFAR